MDVVPPRRAVPVRLTLAVIGIILAVVLGVLFLWLIRRVLALLVVAAIFAVILNPAVDFLERVRIRRSVGTLLVFLAGTAATTAMLYMFIRPVVRETQEFIDDFPAFVEDAKAGRGTVGRLVQRYNVDEWVEENQDNLEESLRSSGEPALKVAARIASTLFALVTILVLTFLMLLEGPRLLAGGLNILPPPRRERVRRVASDCARAITGYMAGNLVISLIAGTATFIWLTILGVPFAGVLGLWVAFADLIPLVGATLGAIPTVGVAFLHSTGAGIATLVFYIAYQQFENHVLQVTVMSKTVKINPLAVLVSVLVGVQLFGILGALLAIPVAGIVQVIGRDIYDEHSGRFKAEPTIGADERPVGAAPRPGPGGGVSDSERLDPANQEDRT